MGRHYDPRKHHRRSIRLQDYDYAMPGAYFVTICIQHQECLLGAVVNGEMVLNAAGQMVQRVWDELPAHYPGVEIDAFVVMPNHVHGIVVLTGDAVDAGQFGQARGPAPTIPARGVADDDVRASGAIDNAVRASPCGCPDAPRLSLPDVVHRFKSYTTAQYRHGVKQRGWPPFPGRLWQRNYWEPIIRDEPSLRRIRRYIEKNPLTWSRDQLRPDAPPQRPHQS
jgi:putative transposase